MGLVGLMEFDDYFKVWTLKELDDPQLFNDPSYSMIPSYSVINWKYGL